MQQNIGGDEVEILMQRKPHKTPSSDTSTYTRFIRESCLVFGHTWEYFGITGLKRCTVCHIQGFCPLCTPTPPIAEAKPFYCTKHTPQQEECGV
jgi:hypothetical protein